MSYLRISLDLFVAIFPNKAVDVIVIRRRQTSTRKAVGMGLEIDPQLRTFLRHCHLDNGGSSPRRRRSVVSEGYDYDLCLPHTSEKFKYH